MGYSISQKSDRALAKMGLLFCTLGGLGITAPKGFAEVPSPVPQRTTTAPQPAIAPVAGTVYVSDELKTALRTGPTTKHRISSFLPSGTPLSVKTSKTEWLEVDVIGTNKSGWISRLSVQNTLGAKALLAKKEASLTALKARLNNLQQDQGELNRAHQESLQSLATTTEKFDRLNREHEELQALSKNAIKNHQKMQETQQEMATMRTKYNELEIAHELLRQDNYNRGLMHGLGAVLFGIFIALIIPRLKSKPRSNHW